MAQLQTAYEYAEINLKDGEVICPECKGHSYNDYSRYCHRCFGAGKLDWIDMIVGKEHPYGSSSKSSTRSCSINQKRRI